MSSKLTVKLLLNSSPWFVLAEHVDSSKNGGPKNVWAFYVCFFVGSFCIDESIMT